MSYSIDGFYFINIFGTIDNVYGRVYTTMKDAAQDSCRNVICEYSHSFLSEPEEKLTEEYIHEIMRTGVRTLMDSLRRRDPDAKVTIQQMILMKDLSDDSELLWDITCFNSQIKEENTL